MCLPGIICSAIRWRTVGCCFSLSLQVMLYLLISSLLASAMNLQAMPALDEKGVVDGAIHHNDKEVALRIEVVVPVEDNNVTAVEGLFDGFFHTMKTALKLDETTTKVCVVVSFPESVGDEHKHSWKCIRLLNSPVEEWRACVLLFLGYRTRHDNSAGHSGEMEEEENSACELNGAPTVKLLVTKVEEADDWQQKTEKVKDSAFNSGTDLVIVVNSFSNDTMDPFRIVFYSADKSKEHKKAEQENCTFDKAYSDLSSTIWPSAVQDLLKLCNYTVINTACYFYSPSATVKDKGNKTCMLGYARNGTEFNEASHQKYCVRNYAFQASPKCADDTDKCKESCRKVLVRGQCQCQTDLPKYGKRRLYIPEKRRADERHLWQCDGYGEEVYDDCHSECESGLSAGGIVMIVIGMVVFVLTIVGVFTCYWLCFRQRKPAPDPKYQGLVPPPSMPEEAPEAMDPSPQV